MYHVGAKVICPTYRIVSYRFNYIDNIYRILLINVSINASHIVSCWNKGDLSNNRIVSITKSINCLSYRVVSISKSINCSTYRIVLEQRWFVQQSNRVVFYRIGTKVICPIIVICSKQKWFVPVMYNSYCFLSIIISMNLSYQ